MMTKAEDTVATELSSIAAHTKEEVISTDMESQAQDDNWARNDGSNYRKPAEHLTKRLKVKIFVVDSLISAILGSGINFAIAYGACPPAVRFTNALLTRS